MKKYLFGVFLLLLLFPQSVHADIIPVGSTEATLCTKITNLSDFPKLVLIAETTQVTANKKTYALVQNNTCMSLEGYKLNGFTLYAANAADIDSTKLDSFNYSDKEKFYPLSEPLSSSGTYYVDKNSTERGTEYQYKILGIQNHMLDVYRVKTITTYSDKEPVEVLGTKPIETIGVSYLDSIGGTVVNQVLPTPTRMMKFTDVEGHFAFGYIKELYEKGIIDGRSETTFAPDATMNRAEALKLIMKAFYQREDFDGNFNAYKASHKEFMYNYFTDVPMDAWYAKYVQKAISSSILNKDKTLFHGGDQITRAEYLKMVMGASMGSYFEDKLGADVPNFMEIPLPPEAQKEVFTGFFTDVPGDSWYAHTVAAAANEGVIDKAQKFFPERPITRGEGAKILRNAMGMMIQ